MWATCLREKTQKAPDTPCARGLLRLLGSESVAVVLGLVRALDVDADVLRLLLR